VAGSFSKFHFNVNNVANTGRSQNADSCIHYHCNLPVGLTTVIHCCLELLASNSSVSTVQSVQNAAARSVTGTRRSDHITPVLQSHGYQFGKHIRYKIAMVVHKCLNGRAPQYLVDQCRLAGVRRSGTRSAGRQKLEVTMYKTSFSDSSFAVAAPQVWKSLYIHLYSQQKATA